MVHTTEQRYEEFIVPHSESKRFRGKLDNPSCDYAISNEVCGDYVKLHMELGENEVLRKAVFEGRGCIVSQAAASILCEFVEGKSVADLRQFTAEEMLELLRIPLTPRRMQCGLLAFTALKTLLYSMDEGVY